MYVPSSRLLATYILSLLYGLSTAPVLCTWVPTFADPSDAPRRPGDSTTGRPSNSVSGRPGNSINSGFSSNAAAVTNIGASSSYSPFYYYSQAITGGWTVHLTAQTPMTIAQPMQAAGSHLERFYQGVYDECLHRILHQAPPTHLILRLGALSLTLASEKSPVPWEVIAFFARVMRDSVQRGFTALYSVMFLPPGISSVHSPLGAQLSMAAGLSDAEVESLASNLWSEAGFSSGGSFDPDSDEDAGPPCKKRCSPAKAR